MNEPVNGRTDKEMKSTKNRRKSYIQIGDHPWGGNLERDVDCLVKLGGKVLAAV